ncbi:hypothetical protein MD484_g8327, partial [Candolleomyces efflorescens]
MGAMHESDERYPPPLCHPGTREVVVTRIVGWHLTNYEGKKPILWVHAPAGYGKTAVAGTVTEKLKAMEGELGFNPVGATFFFWRTSPERSSPTRLIITLAYQLAQSIPELLPRIEAVVESEPNVVKLALEIQLLRLIVEPFECLPGYDTMPNRLVIVDGIDECINSDREPHSGRNYGEQREGVQVRVLDIIHSLQSHHLPLSFLILSRPKDVGDHMNDVKRFVRGELSRIATSFDLDGADDEWPEEAWLVYESGGHILYAATVIRHIDDPYGDPRQLLRDIIQKSETGSGVTHSTPLSSLYELYGQIMRSCPERNKSLMLEVLEDLVAFRIRNHVRRLPCGKAFDILDHLSGRSLGSGIRALRPLHAVLRAGDLNEAVYNLFIHSSFTEFLLAPVTPMEFRVDLKRGQERLLSNMLDCMSHVTIDAIDKQPEEHILFALNNWCHLWSRMVNGQFQESRPLHIQMIEKLLALDLPACLIQSYLTIEDSQKRNRYDSPFWHLFASPTPSTFFIGTVDFEPTDSGWGAFTHSVVNHTQSALDTAFITVLTANNLPPSSPNATWLIASDCVDYLKEVTTHDDWRENSNISTILTKMLITDSPFVPRDVSKLSDDKLGYLIVVDGLDLIVDRDWRVDD